MHYGELEIRQLFLSMASCRQQIDTFLARHELRRDTLEYYAGVFLGEEMVAGGGYDKNVIKCIAAEEDMQGMGLSNALISHLRQLIRQQGYSNAFLFTKPRNRKIFESLAFYPVGQADKAILLESDRRGVTRFCEELAKHRKDGRIGAIVMNCNPFTRGHQYLAEYAAKHCDHLHIFVVEEDRSAFPFAARKQLVQQGCAHLSNVTVHSGGPYIISGATFPSYFIKEMSDVVETHAQLDIDIFARHIVPALGIHVRFAGEEPQDGVTRLYNAAMQQLLPQHGVEVCIIPRLQEDGAPISASRVRALIKEGQTQQVEPLVPESTYEYIRTHRQEIRL